MKSIRMPLADLAKDGIFVDGDWVESKDQDPEGDVRLIQLADVGDGFFVDKSARFLTSAKAKGLKCTFLERGDILVARMPDPLGRACVFPGVGQPCVTVVDVCIIRPGETIDRRWLLHAINAPSFRKQIERHIKGTTRQRISRTNLGTIELDVPPVSHQRRIADILDKADTIRRKRKEAIALTEELLRSTFLEMFGDPVTNPKGWPTETIDTLCDEIVDCVNRTAPIVDGPTPYKMIRTTNVKAGKVHLDAVRFVSRDTFEVWNRRCVPQKGDVLLTREAPVGEAGLLLSDDQVFLGQRLMLYRPNLSVLLPEYLVQSFLGPHLQAQFDTHGSGSTVKHLPLPVCRSLSVRVPPIDLQSQFAAFSRTLRRSLVAGESALSEAEGLFNTLVARAFAGELESPR